jgi:hypothetical protein
MADCWAVLMVDDLVEKSARLKAAWMVSWRAVCLAAHSVEAMVDMMAVKMAALLGNLLAAL